LGGYLLVEDQGKVVGIVRKDVALEVFARNGVVATIREVANQNFEVVTENTTLFDIFPRMAAGCLWYYKVATCGCRMGGEPARPNREATPRAGLNLQRAGFERNWEKGLGLDFFKETKPAARPDFDVVKLHREYCVGESPHSTHALGAITFAP
jgi:hypothetical protein